MQGPGTEAQPGVLPERFEPTLSQRADGEARRPPSRLPRCWGVAPSSRCIDCPLPTRHPGRVAHKSAQLPHELSQQCHEAVPVLLDRLAQPVLFGQRCSTSAGRPTQAGYATRLDTEREALMGYARRRRAPCAPFSLRSGSSPKHRLARRHPSRQGARSSNRSPIEQQEPDRARSRGLQGGLRLREPADSGREVAGCPTLGAVDTASLGSQRTQAGKLGGRGSR